jgi:Xaa-Pro aminopeptidase
MDFKGRISRLAEVMSRERLDALLVTHLPNIRYLCGFTGSAGVLLVGPKPVFFTDGRYAEQAAAEVVGARVVIAKGAALIAVAKQAGRLKKGSIGIEAEHLSVSAGDALAEVLPKGIRLKSTGGMVEALRMIKEPAEIDLMREAIDLGCELLPAAFKAIRPGEPEVRVAAEEWRRGYVVRDDRGVRTAFGVAARRGERSGHPG